MNRRRLLACLGAAAVPTAAGCTSGRDADATAEATRTATGTDGATQSGTDGGESATRTRTTAPATAGQVVFEFETDREDGDRIWSVATGDDVFSSPTAVAGTVYVGSDDGTLYGIATAGDGSSRGSRVRQRALGHLGR